jgi:hypothetical protein
MTRPMATKEKSTQDVIARLAGRGEEALNRLTDLPGGNAAVRAFNDLRQRVDDLGKKVRGIDELEKRITKLERELSALKRVQKPAPKAPDRRAAP